MSGCNKMWERKRALTLSCHEPLLKPSKLPPFFVIELSDVPPTFAVQSFDNGEIQYSPPALSADHLLELAS
jgi:hypothetical protein